MIYKCDIFKFAKIFWNFQPFILRSASKIDQWALILHLTFNIYFWSFLLYLIFSQNSIGYTHSMFSQNESLINKTCVAVMNCKTPHFYEPIRSLAFVVQPTISAIPSIFKILFFERMKEEGLIFEQNFYLKRGKISCRSCSMSNFRKWSFSTLRTPSSRLELRVICDLFINFFICSFERPESQ